MPCKNYGIKLRMKQINVYLLEETINKGNCPDIVSQTVSYVSSKKFIPDKHRIVQLMPALPIRKILLKITHNII